MDSWQYPYDVQYLEILDSLKMAYVETGKGKTTLLFIHGLGSNLQAWQKNIETLRNKYQCIALDLPGYGKSSKGDYDFTMTFFAKTIHAFIKKKKLKNVVLVGHSMGGQISIHTFLQDKKAIKKLVLIAPAGLEVFSAKEKNWFKNIYTPAVVKMTTNEQIIKNFELNFYQMPDDARFMIEDRLELKASSEYDAYCEMIPQCVMGMLNEPVFDSLEKINIPTLIVYGKDDSLIPNKFLHPQLTTQQVAEAGRKKITDSKLIMINTAGHFVNWEQSKATNAAILDFLIK